MKRTSDLILDELIDHGKSYYGSDYRYYGGSYLGLGERYSNPPNNSSNNSTSEVKNITSLKLPLKEEKLCCDLEEVKNQLGLKQGDKCWGFSNLHNNWFYGEILGDNGLRIKMFSATYKLRQQTEDDKLAVPPKIINDGIFYANRLSKTYFPSLA